MNEQFVPVQQMPMQQMPMQQMPASGGLAAVPAVQHTPMQRAKVLCSGGQMLTGCAVLMNIVLCLVIMSRQGPSACPAPSDTGHHEMTSPAAYNHGYMGAALAVAGGCLGAGYAVGIDLVLTRMPLVGVAPPTHPMQLSLNFRGIVHAVQAANGGTMLSAVLSAPLVLFGLIVGVIIVGAIPYDAGEYCEQAGFAHLWAGVAYAAAAVAGGLAIGMTRECSCDGLNEPSRRVSFLAHTSH